MENSDVPEITIERKKASVRYTTWTNGHAWYPIAQHASLCLCTGSLGNWSKCHTVNFAKARTNYNTQSLSLSHSFSLSFSLSHYINKCTCRLAFLCLLNWWTERRLIDKTHDTERARTITQPLPSFTERERERGVYFTLEFWPGSSCNSTQVKYTSGTERRESTIQLQWKDQEGETNGRNVKETCPLIVRWLVSHMSSQTKYLQ